ncbi:CD209 antigen-like protein E [Hoplias malabaricus]|uniref:CD209 antigen-like protein E n=1 Tax=Hoplias malabaricus TaxID=27720 RepID=UPI00346294A8
MSRAERETLLSSIKNLTTERDQLKNSNQVVIKERDQLKSSYQDLTKEKEQINKALNANKSTNTDLLQRFGIKSLGSSYYYISDDSKTWSEARNVCKAKGADLLIINSKEEQEFIKKLNLYVWLGLTDAEKEGEWKWVDGSLLTNKFWKTGEPNDAHGDEDCVAFAETSDPLMTWNDIPCSYKAGWICEYTYAML